MITTNVEAAIWDRLLRPERADLAPEAARALLDLAFDEEEREQLDRLAQKARDGTLTGDEEQELEGYRRVGYLLDLLHSKARNVLQRSQASR